MSAPQAAPLRELVRVRHIDGMVSVVPAQESDGITPSAGLAKMLQPRGDGVTVYRIAAWDCVCNVGAQCACPKRDALVPTTDQLDQAEATLSGLVERINRARAAVGRAALVVSDDVPQSTPAPTRPARYR